MKTEGENKQLTPRKTKHCARGKCNPVTSWLSNQWYFGLTVFSTVKMMKMFEYVFNQNQDIFVLGGWGRQRESEQISSQQKITSFVCMYREGEEMESGI